MGLSESPTGSGSIKTSTFTTLTSTVPSHHWSAEDHWQGSPISTSTQTPTIYYQRITISLIRISTTWLCGIHDNATSSRPSSGHPWRNDGLDLRELDDDELDSELTCGRDNIRGEPNYDGRGRIRMAITERQDHGRDP